MSEHTPGPWEVFAEGHVVGPSTEHHRSTTGNQTSCVANCLMLSRPSYECLANANLISAAPDLLAACEAALEWCEKEIHSEYDGTGVLLERRLAELDFLRVAIDKARGQ